jgi:hypothetical protein
MRVLVSLMLFCCLASFGRSASVDQGETRQFIKLLNSEAVLTRTRVKFVPNCVVAELRRWYKRLFVLVESVRQFPKLRDIRRAGDGRFRFRFCAQLRNGTSVLCFEDYASLGITNPAVVFSRDARRCHVIADFAYAEPLMSMGDLRDALQRNSR